MTLFKCIQEYVLRKRQLPLSYFIIIPLSLAFLVALIPSDPGRLNSAQMAAALKRIHQEHTRLAKRGLTDPTLAALTIYLEARGESFAGKMAVAAVIRNRMQYRYHSDGTVKGTVLRANQFEPWITLRPEDISYRKNNVKMQESLLAWQLVQDGRNIVNHAVLFFNPQIVRTPRWARVNRKVATIGGHHFFNRHRI